MIYKVYVELADKQMAYAVLDSYHEVMKLANKCIKQGVNKVIIKNTKNYVFLHYDKEQFLK